MTESTFINNSESECAKDGEFPTMQEFMQEVGVAGSAALYTSVLLLLTINAILFLLLILKFYKSIPQSQVLLFKNIYLTSVIIFIDAKNLLGDLPLLCDIICADSDGVSAQVNRVPDGSVQSVRGNGDQQVCGTELDVVGR